MMMCCSGWCLLGLGFSRLWFRLRFGSYVYLVLYIIFGPSFVSFLFLWFIG